MFRDSFFSMDVNVKGDFIYANALNWLHPYTIHPGFREPDTRHMTLEENNAFNVLLEGGNQRLSP
jgi:hypothetical protein